MMLICSEPALVPATGMKLGTQTIRSKRIRSQHNPEVDSKVLLCFFGDRLEFRPPVCRRIVIL